MAIATRDLFRGFDWVTQNEAAAAALNTLDSIQSLWDPLRAEADLSTEDMLSAILDGCEDFSAELDMLLADLNLLVSGRFAVRWAAAEARFILSRMQDAVREQLLCATSNYICFFQDKSGTFSDSIGRLKDIVYAIEN